MLHEFAPAKINLFLHAGDKRPDGFHELESLVVFADVGDYLGLEGADGLSLAVDGPFAPGLPGETDNLVLKAAHEFTTRVGCEGRAKITLTKNLPIASGLGGGSSDAAAAMRGLCRLWPGQAGLTQLWGIAPNIGSDVAVCVLPGAWWMTGRGERFSTVRGIGTIDAVLVNPGVPLATAAVFERLEGRSGIGQMARPANCANAQALADYLKPTKNDLEEAATKLCPPIADVLSALAKYGARLARMSGSGATCFALFDNEGVARFAAESIEREQPGWWVRTTKLNSAREWKFQ
jgi:4-diphosphocytidyl-2-C-methyl-D-erythritol kinase